MRRSLAVVAALALGACSSDEPPEPVPANVAYQHVPSGLVFPTQVGPFMRTSVHPGRNGSDGVIVGYAHMTPKGPMLITVTLEASPPPAQAAPAIDPGCREIFGQRKADIAKSNTALKWLEDRDTRITLAGESQPAQIVSFDYEFRGTPVRGYLFVACHVGGRWTLQYRVTAPRDPPAGQTIASFMAVLPAQPAQGAAK